MSNSQLNPLTILQTLGLTNPSAVTPITGGADTALWRVEAGDQTYALRLFRPEQTQTAQKEQLVMPLAAAAGLPVPTIHAAATWQDRPALLLSWCPGRTLAQELRTHPWRIPSLGRAFGRMQAQIHTTPIPTQYHPHQYDWITWAGPDQQPLQERLRTATLQPPTLLHLDYHPLNVMTDGRHITAILDWANAHVGDLRADFARTYTILRLDPTWPPTLPIRLLRLLLTRAWQHGYYSVHPHSSALNTQSLFYAWAGAAMLKDLSPRLGRPNGLNPHPLDPVHRWTEAQKQQAGLPSS
jgi:aminoglycoside phosphotransferase (APT) family kinase protein